MSRTEKIALKKEYAELESLQDELAGEQANVEKLLADKNIQINNLTSVRSVVMLTS